MQSYLGWVFQLVEHYPEKSTVALSSCEVLDFLIHLKNDRKLAGSTLNQAVCALRTLYRDHLGLPWDIWDKIKITRDVEIPHVMTREDVSHLLGCFRKSRYQTYFTVVYQCGLRMSEALSIRPKDIDGERLVIRVKGKGGKWRQVPISERLLQRLRLFWKSHRNTRWLFPGVGRGWNSSGISESEAQQRCEHSMTKASVWSAMRVARAESGLDKKHAKITNHTLRHSYATHMLEAGVHVRQVADYLGHTTLKPTMIYLHLTEVSETQAREALNTLADS
jgi:integrase